MKRHKIISLPSGTMKSSAKSCELSVSMIYQNEFVIRINNGGVLK